MTTWPASVWEAINRLAEADLSNYRPHVFDREKFLGTARAKRVEQHKAQIETLLATEPNPTAEHVAGVLDPKKPDKPRADEATARAAARMYERNDQRREPLPRGPLDCPTCANTGLVAEQPCTCERGRFRAFIRGFRRPDLAEASVNRNGPW